MTKRLNKLERMTTEEKMAESTRFWEASNDALFPPETIAIVLGMSLAWLQAKRCNGGGISFIKPNGNKIIYYQKSDVINFIKGNKLANTA